MADSTSLCLVTGATGYIGSRLVPRLLAAGYRVRCLVRSPRKLSDVPWRNQVEVVRADLLDADSVREACAGVDVVYYLAHSLTSKGFAELDRRSAAIVSHAARQQDVTRVVYLGGVHPASGQLSEHLRSRAEVGNILLGSGVPTAVLQAAVIIGSGSASFEILRHLTERLPLMVTPRWVRNRVQPIAIRDVLHYLVAAARLPEHVTRSFDIGGPDVLTYAEMMAGYAAVAGLPRRCMIPVKVLSPKLSSLWINLVTPVRRSIAGPLIESLISEAVCTERDIDDYLPRPDGGLTSYREAVALALSDRRRGASRQSWTDASPSEAPWEALPSDPSWAGGTIHQDVRVQRADAPAEDVWRRIERTLARHGRYSHPLVWAARGWSGLWGRRSCLGGGPETVGALRTGDVLGWWRVERLDQGHFVRLRALARLPGRAWLEMSVEPESPGEARYHQRAVFFPSGLSGHLSWLGLMPLHSAIFRGMVRAAACGHRPY